MDISIQKEVMHKFVDINIGSSIISVHMVYDEQDKKWRTYEDITSEYKRFKVYSSYYMYTCYKEGVQERCKDVFRENRERLDYLKGIIEQNDKLMLPKEVERIAVYKDINKLTNKQ